MSIPKKSKSAGNGYTLTEMAEALSYFMSDVAIRFYTLDPTSIKVYRIDIYYTQGIHERDSHYELFRVMNDHKFTADGFSKLVGNDAGITAETHDTTLLKITYLTEENL